MPRPRRLALLVFFAIAAAHVAPGNADAAVIAR
jgi:hypothetical protein